MVEEAVNVTVPPHDPRIQQMLDVMLQLAEGNLAARTRPTRRGDELDALMVGLNLLAEEVSATALERREAEEALRRTYEELERKVQERTAALSRKTLHLERVNDELQQFTYVVSHDLKAPLRAIANLVTWLEEDLGERLSGENRKQMELLRGRVQRMHKLVDGLLQYSRAGTVSGPTEAVDSRALVSEIVNSYSMPANFRIHVAPDLPTLTTHRLQLRQVFANLISNAIKHHDRPDGNVWVSACDNGEFFEFSVADDGPGIDPKYHQKIFEMFQTLTARDKTEHTGIGLALVKKLVEDAGGEIRVESRGERGTDFRFTWPKKPPNRD